MSGSQATTLWLLAYLLALGAAGTGAQAPGPGSCDWAGPRVPCNAGNPLAYGPPLTERQCVDAGCCWLPPEFQDEPQYGPQGGPRPLELPTCFMRNGDPSAYTALDTVAAASGGGGSSGSSSSAQAIANGFAALLQQASSTQPELGADVAVLHADVVPVSNDIWRVRVMDAQHPRWQVPPSLFAPDSLIRQLGASATALSAPDMQATSLTAQTTNSPFSVVLSRTNSSNSAGAGTGSSGAGAAGAQGPSTGTPLLNTTGTRLVFKDQYLELTTWLSPTAALYGGGSANKGIVLVPRNGYPLTSWNRDLRPAPRSNVNSYSTNTLLMALDGGVAHGYFMVNSNGMEVVPGPDRLTWRMIGGIVDLYVLAGPTPLDVMRQFSTLVGRAAMPPHWALGFHSGWHYNRYANCSQLEEVVANYSAAGIPVQAFYNGGDYMDSYRLMTLDPVNFPADCMARLMGTLHAHGQKWLPWVLPALKVDPSYPFYNEATQAQALLLDPYNRSLLGQLFAGPSVYLDWAQQEATQLLTQHMKEMHDRVPFDGWMVGYEEPTSFCGGDTCQLWPNVVADNLTGTWDWEALGTCPWCGCYGMNCIGISCTLSGCTSLPGLPPEASQKLAVPPYTINSGNAREGLGGVSNLGRHVNGWRLYDTHNLYGTLMGKAMNEAMQQVTPGRRPFVMSRATFPGASAYTATYNGNSCWGCGEDDVAMGGSQTINMGLAGFPMAGSDITCQEDSWLCANWVMSGAFFPLARGHDQELYRWNETIAAARAALRLRYQLLPLYYTLMYEGSARGWPVLRPLWMTFPADNNTYAIPAFNTTWQFMLGDSVLFSPAIGTNATNTTAYFPQGLWYSAWNWSHTVDARQAPLNTTLNLTAVHDPATNVTTYPTPVHYRGGTIVPLQQAANSTDDVKASPLSLLLALPDFVPSSSPSDDGGAVISATPVGSTGTGAGTGAGAGPGGSQVSEGSASWQYNLTGMVYNDDGETLQPGSSPCHFLTATSNITYNATSHRHSGTLLLALGPQQAGPAAPGTEPEPFQTLPSDRVAASDSSSSGGGGGAGTAAGSAGVGAGGAESGWPALGNITVLGWRAPVTNATLLELGQVPAGSPPQAAAGNTGNMMGGSSSGGGAAAVLQSHDLATTAASAGNTAAAPAALVNGPFAPGSLHFDLGGLNIPLRCGAGVLLIWHEA